MNNAATLNPDNQRILSIDFFRGITMLLLIGEFTGLFGYLLDPAFTATPVAFIGRQLHHAEWQGLHFWDLIQPFFMFIVGVAMPFSFSCRWERGDTWGQTFKHVLQRSGMLLFLGWALYCIGPGKITFQFTNVLAQLSFTYLVAFLMMRRAVKWQLLFSFGLILFTDLLYRYWSVPGFDQPFIKDHNFGTWFDTILTGGSTDDGWVIFNAIPTTAHTIWGVVAGMILMTDWGQKRKVATLLIAGVTGIIFGLLLGQFIPIIKRICTSSFILASGGFAFVALALSYWAIDVLNFRKNLTLFTVIGTNPLFIYLFASTGGTWYLTPIFKPFVTQLFWWAGNLTIQMILCTTVWAAMWYICYFLYQRKIYIKL